MEAQRHTFEQLFEDHLNEIQRLIARHTNNLDDRLDLTQEIFIKAYSAFSQFRGESSVSTWLYKIAINVCANATRSRQRQKKHIADDTDDLLNIPAGMRDVIDELAHNEEQRLLKQALRSLSAEQILVLSLRFSDGLTLPEIAEVLGSPIDTVKSRMRTALGKIQSAYNYMHLDIASAEKPPSIEVVQGQNLDDVLIEGDRGGRIYHNLGSLYLRKGLIVAALKEWSKAQRVAPTFLDAYLASAQQYVEINQPARAVDTLETAVSKIQNADLHVQLAGLYLDFFGDVEEGMHHSTRALEIEPQSAAAHYTAGRVYFRQAKLQEVLVSPKYGQDSPDNVVSTSWRKSASHLEEAIRIKEVFPEASSFLALTYLNDNQIEQAVQESATAVDNADENEMVLYHAGWVHYKVRKLEAAENYLKHSIASKATSGKLQTLAEVILAMNRAQDAYSAFQQALTLTGDKAEKAMISANMAAVAMRLGQIDEAIEHAEEAIRWNPNHVHAYCNLAEAHLRKGDAPCIVIDLCLEGLHLSPEHICFHRILAQAYYRSEKFEDALGEATTAVELEPEQAQRWLLRARIFKALQRIDEAMADVATAQDLEPENTEASALLEELQQSNPKQQPM